MSASPLSSRLGETIKISAHYNCYKKHEEEHDESASVALLQEGEELQEAWDFQSFADFSKQAVDLPKAKAGIQGFCREASAKQMAFTTNYDDLFQRKMKEYTSQGISYVSLSSARDN